MSQNLDELWFDQPLGPLLFNGPLSRATEPRVTCPETSRDDVSSTDDDDEEEEEEPLPINAGRPWSVNDKTLMVRMRAGKVPFKAIAKKLGRNHSACQGTFYRIRDQPEYKAILDAGEAYDESNDHEKEEEKGDKKDKKGNKKK